MSATAGLSENWATLWEALADAQPDHVAVVVGEQTSTWRDFDERMDAVVYAAAVAIGYATMENLLFL